jgi:hypothetical protein
MEVSVPAHGYAIYTFHSVPLGQAMRYSLN